MSATSSRFDSLYLHHRRRQLIELRDSLQASARQAEIGAAEIQQDAVSQPREYEEDGQRLERLEEEGLLVFHAVQRMAAVDRALQKIAEGTYGFSDISGAPIPDERLQEVPEAICTLAEQEVSERKDR